MSTPRIPFSVTPIAMYSDVWEETPTEKLHQFHSHIRQKLLMIKEINLSLKKGTNSTSASKNVRQWWKEYIERME